MIEFKAQKMVGELINAAMAAARQQDKTAADRTPENEAAAANCEKELDRQARVMWSLLYRVSEPITEGPQEAPGPEARATEAAVYSKRVAAHMQRVALEISHEANLMEEEPPTDPTDKRLGWLTILNRHLGAYIEKQEEAAAIYQAAIEREREVGK